MRAGRFQLAAAGCLAGADRQFVTGSRSHLTAVGLLTANLLYINQFPDRKADIQAGKLHWVARLDPQTARWGYILIAGLAWLVFVVLVMVGLLPVTALVAMLPAILTFKAGNILIKHANHPQELTPAIQMTILAMLTHGALLSIVLVLES